MNKSKNIYFLRITLIVLSIVLFSFNGYAQKDLYAGIEIGSKGIKISVIDVKNIKKGKYEIQAYWSENIGIAKGIKIDGNLAEEDMQNAAFTVLSNLNKLKDTYKVPEENIYIVGSSGVAMANNTLALVEKIKNLTQKTIEFIDAETEGKMLLKGCIPPSEYIDSIILDIGGGNTKGGYVNDLKGFEFEFFPLELDFGTITLTEEINKTIFNKKDVDDIEVFKTKSFEYLPVLRKKAYAMLESKPIALRRSNIYLSGGAIWAFNNLYYNHENKNDHFIPLKFKDIIEYDAILKNNFIKYERLAKTDANISSVLKVYDHKHLISANNLLLACLESIPDIKNKKIYFAKQGQIAWLVSYVVDRSKKVKKIN